MTYVILAAGEGQRMAKSLGKTFLGYNKCTTTLLNGETLISRHIKHIAEIDLESEIVIVIGHGAPTVVSEVVSFVSTDKTLYGRLKIRFVYNQNHKDGGCYSSLVEALQVVPKNDAVTIIEADSFYFTNHIKNTIDKIKMKLHIEEDAFVSVLPINEECKSHVYAVTVADNITVPHEVSFFSTSEDKIPEIYPCRFYPSLQIWTVINREKFEKSLFEKGSYGFSGFNNLISYYDGKVELLISDDDPGYVNVNTKEDIEETNRKLDS